MTKIKDQALAILDGISEINANEMLVFGQYVTSVKKVELRDSGSICGGRQACLVGSAYLAGGVKIRGGGDLPGLPGVRWPDRDQFLRNRPALRLALTALDDAARPRIAALPRRERELVRDGLPFEEDAPRVPERPGGRAARVPGLIAESLFENGSIDRWDPDDRRITRQRVASLVRRAKVLVEEGS